MTTSGTVLTPVRVPGRVWATVGVVLGGLVSIAANVAHSLIPPVGATVGWRVERGAVVSAIVWPVFLFIAVEILARTPWPQGRWWQALRFGGLLPVALVAAFVSYRHLSGLLVHYGEESLVAYLGPLAVDGLMVMATAAILATGHTRTTESVSASVAVLSISDSPVTLTVPPVTTPAVSEPEPESAASVPSPAQVAARIAPSRPAAAAVPVAVVSSGPRPTRTRTSTPARPLAATLAPSTIDNSVSESDAAQLSLPVVPADLLARAAQVADDYQTRHDTPITAGQLAVRLKVTSDLASHLLAHLHPTAPTVNGRPIKAVR